MSQKLEKVGLPNKEWDYYKLWQEIIAISDSADELALLICPLETWDNRKNLMILNYLQSIINEAEGAIKMIEKVEKIEKLVA